MLIVIFIAIFVLLYIVADGKKIIHAKTIVNKDNSHSFPVVVTIINVLFLIVTTLLLWLSAAFSPLTGEEFHRHNALRLLYFSQNALLWLIYIEYKRTANTLLSKVLPFNCLFCFIIYCFWSAIFRSCQCADTCRVTHCTNATLPHIYQ